MKKVLSLALVLCMAIACFAFAPTSAEIYWGNLLTTTEETISSIGVSAPWGMLAGEGYVSTWSYPFELMYDSGEADNAASVVWSIQDDVLIPGENRFEDAQALQFDLSKTVAQAENPGAWGYKLDIYTDKLEAGKTYTFFFMVKGTSDFTDSIKATVGPESNYAAQGVSGDLAYFTITDEWTLVKHTFTATAATGCFNIILAEPTDITEGYVYVDGIAMVEGDGADIDATYYENNYKDPMDVDGDKLYPDEDYDVDGDGIANKYDTDIDGDGTKNVWDRDIDGDKVLNGDDGKPFGAI